MNSKFLIHLLLIAGLLSAGVRVARAQGTAFTYQGQLSDGGSPANGSYDLTFTLFGVVTNGSAIAGPLTNAATGVSNGMFTVTLDFGANFPGADRWLEIGVQTNGGGGFATLSPRQKFTASPYAITASTITGTLPAASLSGGYGLPVTFNNVSDSFSGNGGNLTGLNASQLTSGTVGDARLGTNVALQTGAPTFAGRLSAPQLNVGTNHNLSAATNYSSIAGGRSNVITTGNTGAFIGAGVNNTLTGNALAPVTGNVIAGGIGNNSTNAIATFVGAGQANSIGFGSDYSLVVGGQSNGIGIFTTQAAILGGAQNTIASNTSASVISGGELNSIGSGSSVSVIGGGLQNSIEGVAALSPQAWYSFIGSGTGNVIQNGATYGVIGGGNVNLITSNSIQNVIGGGELNTNSGAYSFIGGGRVNQIGTNSPYSAIGGGLQNLIQPNANTSTVGGGQGNVVGGVSSVVSGGFSNTVTGDRSAVPGGDSNTASGTNSFAAGHRAKATHNGSFVWADSTETDFGSTTNNQFRVRAAGGAEIVGNLQTTTLNTTGAAEFASAQVDGFIKLTSGFIFGYTNGGTITPASSYMKIAGNSTNAVTLSVTNAIADIAGGTGTILILQGKSDVAPVTINDGANTALGAPSRTLGLNDTLTLIFDGALWIELTYVNH